MSWGGTRPSGAGMRVTIAAAIVVVSGATTIALHKGSGSPPPGGGSGTANIWVDTNGGTCARNASLVSYSDPAACGSFDAANDVAQNGDTIKVISGTYAGQAITGADARTAFATLSPADDVTSSNPVVISTSTGATGISFDSTAAWLKIKATMTGSVGQGNSNLAVSGGNVYLTDSQNIWIEGIDARRYDLNGADNTTFKGNDWGPCAADINDTTCIPRMFSNGAADAANGNTVDGDNYHDMSTTNSALWHVDGMALFGKVTNTAIRNSKFWQNEVTNIRIQQNADGNISTLTIENNWFNYSCNEGGSCARQDAIDIDQGVPGLVMRFNSFGTSATDLAAGPSCDGTSPSNFSCGTVGNNAVIAGNIMGATTTQCGSPNTTYSYNIDYRFSATNPSSACGANDSLQAWNTAANYINLSTTGSFDYHLTGANGPADNFVNCATVSGGCPTTDIDGAARGSTADAGSDER